MNPSNTSYREQTLELERERLRYMRCNTILDIFLVISIFAVAIGIGVYIILIVMKNKSITIS